MDIVSMHIPPYCSGLRPRYTMFLLWSHHEAVSAVRINVSQP